MAAHEGTLYDRIQAEIAKYPDRRSAILGALRLAQEEYGWLSPEAIEEVSRAIDLSPGTCQAVASFYDMFFLEPVGTHVIEVCTNLSCPLVGAGKVVEALEQRARHPPRRDDAGRPDHPALRRVPRRLRLGARSSRSTSATTSTSSPATPRRSSRRCANG